MLLFNRNKHKPLERRHYMGMTRNGQLVEDPHALEKDEELISDVHNVGYDDDRLVPYKVLLREGLPAAPYGHRQVYTGGSLSPERDSWWLLVKRWAIFMSAARAAAQDYGAGMSYIRKAGMWLLGVGIAAFFVCLIILGMTIKSQESAEALKTAAPAVTTVPEEAVNGAETHGAGQPQDPASADPAPGTGAGPGAATGADGAAQPQDASGADPSVPVIVATQEPQQAVDGAAGAPGAPVLTPAVPGGPGQPNP